MTSSTEIELHFYENAVMQQMRVCISLTQHCRLPKCSIAPGKMGKVQSAGRNPVCNHSSTSEQQSDGSTLCKPSGLVIIVWMQRRVVRCQGTVQRRRCQFMNTRFVSEHIKTWASNFLTDLTAAISHQPLSSNLFFYALTGVHTLTSRHANGAELALPL